MERIHNVLAGQGHNVSFVPTTGPKTAGRIARQSIASGADLILAAGGDGTTNEVIEGVVNTRATLGILPSGTANVLATEMGLGGNPERVAAEIDELVPRRIAIGRIHSVNGGPHSRYFCLMAGAGLDAHIVYNLSAPLKAKLGKIAYWVSGFSQLGRGLEEFEVEVEGQSLVCSFALITKVRNYGGDLRIACDANLLEDQFAVVLFHGRSSFRYLKYLAGIATRRLAGMKGVSIFRAQRVVLRPGSDQRIYIQVDGEYAGRLPATVETVPDALTLLMPRSYCGAGP